MEPEAVDALRAQLADMRETLVEKLAARIEGGTLALLGSVEMAIRAVDAIKTEAGGEAATSI